MIIRKKSFDVCIYIVENCMREWSERERERDVVHHFSAVAYILSYVG